MVKGQRLRVSCSTLAATYGGLPETQWTKEGSYQLATRWFHEQSNGRQSGVETAIHQVGGEAGLERIQGNAVAARNLVEINQDNTTDPNEIVWNEALAQGFADQLSPKIPKHFTIDTAIEAFLADKQRRQKPKTFFSTKIFMENLRAWWGNDDIRTLNENRVSKLFDWLNTMVGKKGKELAPISKKCRWVLFRAFIRFLDEQNIIDRLPKNLSSKRFVFKVPINAVTKWANEEVRAALKALDEKRRCWALLALNCGMTNVDIGGLRKDMVAGSYLTRKRVKTEEVANVPTVTYKLWPETINLLRQFRSDHDTLWLASDKGTPLWECYYDEAGKVKTKDLIILAWRRGRNADIRLKDYRSIGASLLDDHEVFGRYKLHYLGHSPKSVSDKHYSSPSQVQFDAAMDWMRGQVLA
jgi:hypothetical protein